MRGFYIIALMSVFICLSACGGGGGGSSLSNSGTVSLFVTDNISDFAEVKTELTGVDVIHTGTGASCSVLSSPAALDIVEVASEFLLLDVAPCSPGEYNRVRIGISNAVSLTNSEGVTGTCTFVSYKDEINRPNALHCSGSDCTLDITGMVNVAVNKTSSLTLDFDLKEFEVEDFPEEGCTVTMKVSPLNANDIAKDKQKGVKESVSGVVSGLDTSAQSFTLTKRDDSFKVLYNGVSQTGIDGLLELASDEGLRTKARCSEFDPADNTCTASEIEVKAEGTVSALSGSSFILTFDGTAITVDYSGAEVEGALADGSEASVELTGSEGANYIASEVEVEEAETKEDRDRDKDKKRRHRIEDES